MPWPRSGVSAAWENWVDYAAITSDRAPVGNLTLEKLKIGPVGERTRFADLSAGDSETTIYFDFGKPRRMQLAAWLRTRRNAAIEREVEAPCFAKTDTVRHRFSNLSLDGDELHNSGFIESGIELGYGYHVYAGTPNAPLDVEARYGSFTFRASSREVLPENFVDWGWAFYGPRLDFRVGFKEPFEEGFRDGATIQTAPRSPSRYVSKTNKPWRVFSVPFQTLPDDETPELRRLLFEQVGSGLVLLCADLANPGRTTIRALNSAPSLKRTHRRWHSSTLTLEEAY